MMVVHSDVVVSRQTGRMRTQ